MADHSSTALLDPLGRLSRSRAEAALAPLGMRSRHLVALTLLREHGPGTQQALAASLSIDRTNLVGLLNELEAGGHVTRHRSPEDRRRHIVALTPAGEQVLQDAEQRVADAEEELLQRLSAEERETLYALLARATNGHAIDCVGEAGLRDPQPQLDAAP